MYFSSVGEFTVKGKVLEEALLKHPAKKKNRFCENSIFNDEKTARKNGFFKKFDIFTSLGNFRPR
jgi:hypothetical protein